MDIVVMGFGSVLFYVESVTPVSSQSTRRKDLRNCDLLSGGTNDSLSPCESNTAPHLKVVDPLTSEYKL